MFQYIIECYVLINWLLTSDDKRMIFIFFLKAYYCSHVIEAPDRWYKAVYCVVLSAEESTAAAVGTATDFTASHGIFHKRHSEIQTRK